MLKALRGLAFTLALLATGLTAAEEMAEVVVLNDSGATVIPGRQQLTDNGKPLASLPRRTYARLPIAPGPHVLRPDPFLWKQEVILDAQAGAKYYVVIAYKPQRSWAAPLAGSPLVLKAISESEALSVIREMTAVDGG